MLKRALISGIPGTGINVLDLGTVPIPVLRHFVRSDDDVTAGIHVRISPFDQRVVDIRLVNGEGTNLSTVERTRDRTCVSSARIFAAPTWTKSASSAMPAT